MTSNRQLAAVLGISEAAVRDRLADERWPFGRGPWDTSLVPKMRQWAKVTLSPNPAAGRAGRALEGELSLERKAKLSIAVEKAKRLRFEREREQGLYHRVDECQARGVAKVHAVRSALGALARSLHVKLNLTDEQARVVESMCARLCDTFARESEAKS